MATVCMYFQMHQPLRLRRYSVFDSDTDYYDEKTNQEILLRVARKCYVPATQLLLELIRKHAGQFRLSFSITGMLADQLKLHCPEVIALLAEAAATGCVDFLNETYYHSISFLYSRDEFRRQIEKHAEMIEATFGVRPTVFRNTELIYNNDLAHYLVSMNKHQAVLAEGADSILAGRSPNFIYRAPHGDELKILLRNYPLSDDIAFRFANRRWPQWPLTAEKYAGWVDQVNGNGFVCNLFMDYETFGEHQWAETGIFEFLKELPGRVLAGGKNDFKTLSEAASANAATDDFDSPHMISWADTERDLSAWLGNAMQSNALHELYKLEGSVKAMKDAGLLEDWRRLTASDHFYYMCTKYFADGDVHKYFNPYESPYDSYINFMNVLDNLRSRVAR